MHHIFIIDWENQQLIYTLYMLPWFLKQLLLLRRRYAHQTWKDLPEVAGTG
jgi:hypothetical protein